MPIIKPQPMSHGIDSLFWEDVRHNNYFLVQKHKIGTSLFFGTTSYRIIVIKMNYIVAESSSEQEMERDWALLHEMLKQQQQAQLSQSQGYLSTSQSSPLKISTSNLKPTEAEEAKISSALVWTMMSSYGSASANRRTLPESNARNSLVDVQPTKEQPNDLPSSPEKPIDSLLPLRLAMKNNEIKVPASTDQTDEQKEQKSEPVLPTSNQPSDLQQPTVEVANTPTTESVTSPTENTPVSQPEPSKTTEDVPQQSETPAPTVKKFDIFASHDELALPTEKVLNDVMHWEEQKRNYNIVLASLLEKKEQEFETFCQGFLRSLEVALQNKKLDFSKEVQAEMVKAEKERLQTFKNQMFAVQSNATLEILDNEIKQKKRAFKIKTHITKLQALARGYLIRKRFGKDLRREKQRNRCAKEILESERTYCQYLQAMLNSYLKPLQQHAQTAANPVISAEDIAAMFSNVESILMVNKTLLEGLEEKMKNWTSKTSLGDLFLMMAPWFKLYIAYVNNYEKSLQLFNQYNKKPEFVDLIKQLKTPELKQDLVSLLIMPVQRIPRYELLLKEFVKLTPEDHPDYERLNKALFDLALVAKTINESKRKAESMNKIIQIQDALEGPKNLVQPHRLFVKEGPALRERSASSVDYTCYLFLFNDIILVTQRKRSILDTFYYVYKEAIHLSKVLTISEQDGHGLNNGISVILPGKREERFFFSSNPERKAWMEAILQQMETLERNRKSLRIIDTPIKPVLQTEQGPVSPRNDSGITSMTIASPPRSPREQNRRSLTTGRLKRLMDIFSEVIRLEQEIFLFPIELRTLIPDYYKKLNPNYVTDYQARILKLATKIDEIESLHWDMKTIIKNESICPVLDRIIVEGNTPIGHMKDFIAKEFTPSNPLRNEARKHAAEVLKWYIDLYEAWEAILNKD